MRKPVVRHRKFRFGSNLTVPSRPCERPLWVQPSRWLVIARRAATGAELPMARHATFRKYCPISAIARSSLWLSDLGRDDVVQVDCACGHLSNLMLSCSRRRAYLPTEDPRPAAAAQVPSMQVEGPRAVVSVRWSNPISL